MNLTLYHYWRSSASWRVRWALELKGVKPQKMVAINLLSDESESPEHKKRNPMGFVPVLDVDSKLLIESVAILQWLEDTYPKPALFPGDALMRAHIRALCELINAGIQPLQNLTVTEHLTEDLDKRKSWCQHWIRRGLQAYESWVKPYARKYSVGDAITAADLFLIPQCYAAKRNEVDLSEFPLIEKINNAALLTKEAQASAPEKYQPAS